MLILFFVAGALSQPELLAALLRALKGGLRHTDLSQEKAALDLRMHKCRLSRQINGGGEITLKRLSQLPPPTIAWFCVLALDQIGLPKDLRRATRLAFVLAAKRRMARMGATTVSQKRSA